MTVSANCTTRAHEVNKLSDNYERKDSQVNLRIVSNHLFMAAVELFCCLSTTTLHALACFVDGPGGENAWIHDKLSEFRVDPANGKGKPTFQYRLPRIGNVCRAGWILAAGFPNRYVCM